MNKKSIVGNLYYPKDNSYIGIYDSEGNLSEGGQLVSRGDKPIGNNLFGPVYETVSPECTTVSEPFVEKIKFLDNTYTHPFVKVECYGLTYRVLWNPTWMSSVSLSDSKKINLENMSNDELADLSIEINKILKSRE